MNLISLSILVTLIVVVIFGRRRWALIGMMAGVLYLTQGAKVEVFGINLFAMRFLELAGFTRVMAKREFTFSKLNDIDRALFLLYLYSTTVFLIRSEEGRAYQIGTTVDVILCYFTFRGLIQNIDDFRWLLRFLPVLLIPYVSLLTIESITNRNPFALVGGSVEAFGFRDGRPRCLGSFRNPDLLGTLGTSFLPLYIGVLLSAKYRLQGFIGTVLCSGIVWFANSGGPVSAAGVALVGWSLWFMRTKIVLFRRALISFILLLALFMKAPIWYLPAKISSIVGGHGWHRSYLMDIAFKNLSKWWLVGIPIKSTAEWFPYVLVTTGGADITNQYLGYGITAGIVAIGLFIFLLYRAFKKVGEALWAIRSEKGKVDDMEHLLWGMGVMLSVHVVTWLGVSYFDQIYAVWLMQLAAISTLKGQAVGNAFANIDKSKPTQLPVTIYSSHSTLSRKKNEFYHAEQK